MTSKLQDMYIWLGFSPKADKLLIREQGLDHPDRLRVLNNKNVDDICNAMRKPGSENANGMPDRGQQVSMISQKNLKLAAFLFHHRWQCTFDWEITGVKKETVHFLEGQKKLKDEHEYPNVLPKINESDMAGTMDSIKEYHRLHCGVIWAPLTYVIQKTIIVQTYGDYPMYATPDDKMIARMLHLPLAKNKLLSEKDIQTAKAFTAEYKIGNQTVYNVLDQIYKDTDLYPYVKQHKSKDLLCLLLQLARPKPCQC